MRRVILWGLGIALVIAVLAGVEDVFALTSSSSSYQVTETQIGAGSNLLNCSELYCAHPTIGDVTNSPRSSAGGGSSLEFDPIDTGSPSLDVIIEPGISNLGVLTTDKTSTKTMGVKVRSYLSGGYIMQIIGNTPNYGNHFLHALDEGATAQPGVEQFGLNLVANSSPEVGEDPVQVPSDEFSYGKVEPGYDKSNIFKYNSGDVVARSIRDTGRTDYTVSMIINVANSTPSGRYSGDFAVMIIPAF